ncbi:MAG: CDP-glycerol glycerophosphotransferase family protein [Eggerthellaceae bacterium]|nr:CDP-glycerol glycerophosphotransferase family protein [Eggerthellaceae bacterium]
MNDNQNQNISWIPDVSVVMTIYNTAQYLPDAIESVLNQTLGFKTHIELILINDGSTDNSAEICKKYQQEYPENIVYKEQENKGAAAAANAGKRLARGRYVSFLDSDDMWDKYALKRLVSFLDEHEHEIDIAVGRVEYFGEKQGFSHALNYRFDVADEYIAHLEDEWQFFHMMKGNALIKRAAIYDIDFDESLSLSEDALVISQILLDKMACGFLKHAIYKYRRRDDGKQLTDVNKVHQNRVLNTSRFLLPAMSAAKQKTGSIPAFIQYMVMYESQWVVKEVSLSYVDFEEADTWVKDITEILQEIDDDVIMSLRNIRLEEKMIFLRMKYGSAFARRLVYKGNIEDPGLYIGETLVLPTLSRSLLSVRFLDVNNNMLTLEGIAHPGFIFGSNAKIFCTTSRGTRFELAGKRMQPFTHAILPYIFSEDALQQLPIGLHYALEIPLEGISDLSFELVADEFEKPVPLGCGFGTFAKINHGIKTSYFAKEQVIITPKLSGMHISPKTASAHIRKEIAHIANLFTSRSYIKYAILRVFYWLSKAINKKPIWILSDRLHKAGDNGENLFRYITQDLPPDQRDAFKPYFLIEKTSNDYKRLKNYGRTINPRRKLFYAMLFLQANKIVSSHFDRSVRNPFGWRSAAVADLMRFDFIYIQHGVMPGNLSKQLNRIAQNAALITTSAHREHEQLLGDEYGYTPSQVALTGMPRHDALGNVPTEKLVVFLPTWRSKLAGEVMKFERRRKYSEKFKMSEYCQFYNALINDKRLVAAFETYGYKGQFYVHPSFEEQSIDFHGNETIRVYSGLAEYEDILKRAQLMVTDYSSVAFDFAIQKKPIVYSQFDYDHIFDIHFYEEGYFKYQNDAFGPVCYTYETIVDAIIEMLKNNCKEPDVYAQRCEAFFAYHDHSNSKRVYDAIANLDK